MNSMGFSQNQKSWEEEARRKSKRDVREDWREEQAYRTIHSRPLIVGYTIQTGKNCPHAKPYDGSTFLIEDVYDEPDLLPPYNGCKQTSCECKHTRATADQRGKARIVLEFGNAELQAKLTTRKTSSVGFEHSSQGGKARAVREKNAKQSAGCAPVIFVCLAMLCGGIAMIL